MADSTTFRPGSARRCVTGTVEIPLFPLRTVLFPGGILPLRIFEQRYLVDRQGNVYFQGSQNQIKEEYGEQKLEKAIAEILTGPNTVRTTDHNHAQNTVQRIPPNRAPHSANRQTAEPC